MCRAGSRATSAASSSVQSTRARQKLSRQPSVALSASSYGPSPAITALDPRLHCPQIKTEPAMVPRFPLQPMDPNSRRTMIPYCFDQELYYGKQAVYGLNHHDRRFVTPTAEDQYLEPPRRSAYAHTRAGSTLIEPITINSGSPVKTPQSESVVDDLPEYRNDTSKLKGVLWPGMSLFDSATPTARRKRNQKKDASIIQQLEANSLDVEPTEMVWTPSGNLKKQKRISGMVDSSSPMAPTPVKRPRLALAEIGIRQPYFDAPPLGRDSASWMDDRAESTLLYSPLARHSRTRKGKGLEIWRDEEAGVTDVKHDVLFSRPSALKYLTQGVELLSAPHHNTQASPSSMCTLDGPFDKRVGEAPMRGHSSIQSYHRLSASRQLSSTIPAVKDEDSELCSALPANSESQYLGSHGFEYMPWPHQQQFQHDPFAHSRHASLTLGSHHLGQHLMSAYPPHGDWFSSAQSHREATTSNLNCGDFKPYSNVDNQTLFPTNDRWEAGPATNLRGLSGYHHCDDIASTPQPKRFPKLELHPTIGQPSPLSVLNPAIASGLQQLVGAAGITAELDAKFLLRDPGQPVSGNEDTKLPLNSDATYDSDETDEDRTITAPASEG